MIKVNDIVLKAEDNTNQMRVKETLMKVTKKFINIFILKELDILKRIAAKK